MGQVCRRIQPFRLPANLAVCVVHTHRQSVHANGLYHLPNAEILVSPFHYPNAQGALPCRYPDWLDPTLVQFDSGALASFPGTRALTAAGDVRIVPTPGHSLGHQSVLLDDGEVALFFAGDTSFDEEQLLRDVVGGISAHVGQARQSLAWIRAYLSGQPAIYLPSHDPESVARLMTRQIARP